MKRWKQWLGACGLALLWGHGVQAQAVAAPEVAAKSYFLLDVTTQQILASSNADTQVEPASLTKLMTAYVVFDALKSGKLKLDQTVGVSERAWKMPGSRMFIDPSMQVPIEDLIKGMIVQSGNDATVALAEAVGGSVERFVQLMNEQAKSLGMRKTVYHNPEGLPATGHLTTAQDLAILASRLIRDFPQYVGYYAIQRYRYPGTPAANDTNRNLLLFRDPSVDGLKTGFTDAAGYCLVATARRDFPALGQGADGQRRLLSIVLGTASPNARAAESQKLLNWGFSAYQAVRLYAPGQAVVTPKVWKGEKSEVNLGLPQGVIVSVPAKDAGQLKTEVSRPDHLMAPLRKGQAVARLRVLTQGGALVTEVPLVALDDVPEAGLIGRAWDSIRLWIQ